MRSITNFVGLGIVVYVCPASGILGLFKSATVVPVTDCVTFPDAIECNVPDAPEYIQKARISELMRELTVYFIRHAESEWNSTKTQYVKKDGWIPEFRWGLKNAQWKFQQALGHFTFGVTKSKKYNDLKDAQLTVHGRDDQTGALRGFIEDTQCGVVAKWSRDSSTTSLNSEDSLEPKSIDSDVMDNSDQGHSYKSVAGRDSSDLDRHSDNSSVDYENSANWQDGQLPAKDYIDHLYGLGLHSADEELEQNSERLLHEQKCKDVAILKGDFWDKTVVATSNLSRAIETALVSMPTLLNRMVSENKMITKKMKLHVMSIFQEISDEMDARTDSFGETAVPAVITKYKAMFPSTKDLFDLTGSVGDLNTLNNVAKPNKFAKETEKRFQLFCK